MEALTAVGLASNILQFIDCAKSIVSDTKNFYEAASGANDEYQEAEQYARRFQRLAAQVVPSKRQHGGDISRDERELKELGEQCSQIANQLVAVTRDVTGDSHHDWVQSARKAIKARLSSSQIKSLQTRLDRIGQQLVGKLLHTQLNKTEKTLGRMADENRRLSSRRDEDILHLQKQLDYVTKLLKKGESQRDVVISLSGIAEAGTQFSAEQLILGRLFFYGMNERHTNVHVEHNKTLSWIFEKSAPIHFVEFLEGKSSLYWVSGKPGSGKSTTMKYICQHSETQRRLEQWANGNRLIVAKFFFWNAGKLSLLKTQEGFLRSILYQIFLAAPALIPHAFPEDWTAYLSGNPITSSSEPDSFSIEQLITAIQLLCPHLSELNIQICIFVDGLDEYDGRPDDVIRLIEVLKTSKNIKACVSSRPWNAFEMAFGQDQRNKLYMQDLTKSDIRKYVRDTLESNETFQELVESEGKASGMVLVHGIVDAAQGVFLWVILVVRSLLEGLTNADTVSDLQRRLRSFPSDLDGFFDRILFSVDDFYSRKAAKMCLVTLAAQQPLPLMCYWFMDQENSRYALDLQAQPIELQAVKSRFKSMEKRLNACCKGLLEATYVAEKPNEDRIPSICLFNQRVDFLHRTVRDFLRIPKTQNTLLKHASKDFNPDLAICQALLAQVKILPYEEGLFLDIGPTSRLLESFFGYMAALEQEEVPVQVEVELLDELDATLRVQAKAILDQNTSSLCFTFRKGIVTPCIKHGLARYICKVVERKPSASIHELASWLDLASSRTEALFGNHPQLEMIQALLSNGADPNYRLFYEHTPWNNFVDVVTGHCETLGPDQRTIVYNILESYIKYGATLDSGGKFGKMMQGMFTEEQINTLVSLAPEERNPERQRQRENIFRRVPGFRRFWRKLVRES